MTDISHVSSDIAGEKFYGASAEKLKQKAAEAQLAKQDPSVTTGVQWAAVQTPGQAQAAVSAGNGAKGTGDKGPSAPAKNYEMVQPSIDDVAVLSTSVSLKDESVEAPRQNVVTRFLADRLNMDSLAQSYKEFFKKSRSHNLLLERFMANVKFSSVKALMTMLGVSSEEQVKMQSEVRGEALAEIDSKLKNDWAYTKVMLEITSGAN